VKEACDDDEGTCKVTKDLYTHNIHYTFHQFEEAHWIINPCGLLLYVHILNYILHAPYDVRMDVCNPIPYPNSILAHHTHCNPDCKVLNQYQSALMHLRMWFWYAGLLRT